VNVRVRLYGTWGEGLSPDQRSGGLEIELPDGGTVGELLLRLGIAEARGAVVIVEGRVRAVGDRLRSGDQVSIFQAIGGG
jgi:sulfur carrier protein ThiS